MLRVSGSQVRLDHNMAVKISTGVTSNDSSAFRTGTFTLGVSGASQV